MPYVSMSLQNLMSRTSHLGQQEIGPPPRYKEKKIVARNGLPAKVKQVEGIRGKLHQDPEQQITDTLNNHQ